MSTSADDQVEDKHPLVPTYIHYDAMREAANRVRGALTECYGSQVISEEKYHERLNRINDLVDAVDPTNRAEVLHLSATMRALYEKLSS